MNDKLQGEPTYAFRRLGLEDFCTCTKERFDELSDIPDLFEMRIFYDAPPSTAQAVEAALRKAAEVCRGLISRQGKRDDSVRAQDQAFEIAADEILALIHTEAAQVERDAKDADEELIKERIRRQTAEGLLRAHKAETLEIGWLIENGKSGEELRYRTMEQGVVTWTPDHMKALRFARREDAEMFAEEDEGAWRIAEHAWHGIDSAKREG